TIWHSVPTVFRYLVNALQGEKHFPALRFIVLGGEAVRHHDIDMFKRCFASSPTTLYNLYGMTESTYNSGTFITRETEVDQVIIGQPVQGTKIFLVDEAGDEVEPFSTGEIIIASPHVSPGYWQDDPATKARFRRHPELAPMYRTGDLGHMLLNSSIQYTSRKDNKIKI
ncbi:MAG: AMP-binding protein, partial [bacterium]|nr:AMP-binding protein [bacterium]